MSDGGRSQAPAMAEKTRVDLAEDCEKSLAHYYFLRVPGVFDP